MTAEVLSAVPAALAPIKPQLQAILSEDKSADQIAIIWHEEPPVMRFFSAIDGIDIEFVYCTSELAIREALVNHAGTTRLVLLSKFDQVQLGKDVLARLWRYKPQRISPWKSLQQLIGVRAIDPRLTRRYGRWMAEALLNGHEQFRGQVEFGEVLDLDTAWSALAISYLNYSEPNVDLPSLFRWSSTVSENLADQLPSKMREHLGDWLTPHLPSLAPIIERLIQDGRAHELLATGVACSVIYKSKLSDLTSIDEHLVYSGRGRFSERYLGGQKFDISVLAEFGQLSETIAYSMMRDAQQRTVTASLDLAEQWLLSLDFRPALNVSNLLTGSFNQRIGAFANDLKLALVKGNSIRAEKSFNVLKNHILAQLGSNQHRLERMEMALRLTRWVNTNPAPTNDATSTIRRYGVDGSFVDRARSQLWAGDVHEELNTLYQDVSSRISMAVDSQNREFSDYLANIARGDKLLTDLLPVEDALESLVAPLAKQKPVLLVVLDGMSYAVYRELQDDLINNQWVEINNNTEVMSRCLIAALPTITNISRYSLLTGALSSGTAEEEKRGFAKHPELKKVASSKFPPLLLHKQDLQQPGGHALVSEARSAIAGTEHRVIGTVINAIDDQLSSSSQVTVSWDLKAITLLRHVLEAAREANRVVLITSDHGHVLEHNSNYLNGSEEGGERYRLGSNPGDQEVLVSGPRVVTPSTSAILPWSESIRYTKSKNQGYHGGGTLQEITIPVGIFISATDSELMEGWFEVPKETPEWWRIDSLNALNETSVPYDANKKTPPKPKSSKKHQLKKEVIGDLFQAEADEQRIDRTVNKNDWVSALIDSNVYKQVSARAARISVTQEQLRLFLDLLASKDGTVMESIISRELELPKIRVRGFLRNVQKLLNIDGYPILTVDPESSTVKLNIPDLKTQFEL